MSDTHKPKTIVCEEVFDEFSAPSEEEVIDYAKKIGIDPKCEAHLLPIARKGLMQPLPPEWKPCYDSTFRRWYYYNTDTTKTQWEHPLDTVYRQLVKRGRSEGYSSAADDDLKTTAKEDLKSFEEVSDILSSKSNDLKAEEESADMAEKTRTHQPLLLRRKQLQSGGDSIALQVAKVMNSTMKESNLAEFDKYYQTTQNPSIKSSETTSRSVNSTPVTPKQLQPLRRAQTLDPIPLTSSHTKHSEVPIKGILRESSFTGIQSRNLARLNSVQGELPTSALDMEDEKKRSVRFADFERKALDIRFQFSDSEDSLSEEEDVETGSSSPDIVASEGQSPEDGVSTEINNEKKSLDNDSKSNPDLLSSIETQLIEPIDPNKIKNKLLSREAIVAPLKIDSFGNGSDYDESQSSVGKGHLSVNSEKFNTRTEIPYNIPVKEVTTSRFTVRAVPEDSNNLPLKKVKENLATTPLQSDLLFNTQRNIMEMPKYVKHDEKVESYDSIPKEIEEMARKKAAEKLAVFEEKLTKEVQEKISALKKQQNDTLSEIEENLTKLEEEEKSRLKQESESKLTELKISLEEEYRKKESEIRTCNEKAVQELMKSLDDDRKVLMTETRTSHELILSNYKKEEEQKLNEEKRKLAADFELEVQKRKDTLESKLALIKEEEEAHLNLVKQENEIKLQELEEKYKTITIKEEQKFQTDIKKVEEEYTSKLTQLKAEKESELKRVQTEWEDKITATTLQHKTTLDSAMIDHENSMATLRNQFQQEEDNLKKYHAEQIEAWNLRLKKLLEKEPSSVGQINRDFEKMRCEKRLIEDKYRSLKDKYLQLKTDMKVAVERKLQSRARRKRENLSLEKDNPEEKDTIRNERSKNNNTEEPVYQDKSPQPTKVTPRIVEPFPVIKDAARELADNDPSSDDQYISTSLSSTFPTDADQKNIVMNRAEVDRRRKHSKVKGKEKYKDRQGNMLEDVRTQLQELEEIEEQIPANSQGETYLRYPFHGPGLSTSAEVDFYRHRVIVEQEAVRAARECLLQQKKDLEARQSILRTNNNTSTMQQLQQQERDLTEMEVSLHRTRALLGEKMIRLRLLGQTLNRLVDETPSDYNGASGDPQLKQGSSAAVEESLQVSSYPLPIPGAERIGAANKIKSFKRTPTSRAEIEARIQGLREWLQKPQQSSSDWNQLTL
ncbi:centrosomal protein 164 isoform X3 [Rhodnius prolixus]|uniref:centrosomal protein 164 isoform X3 n=1 Tax=Rhodnius prolixus TaxID=13249 RepID=UPI003D18E968